MGVKAYNIHHNNILYDFQFIYNIHDDNYWDFGKSYSETMMGNSLRNKTENTLACAID